MSTTTPNFNFPIPQSTDLVKDGATAIASLGTAIDTDFVDLKGGTTGQVLAKASSADMDFSWVAQDDSNAIQNSIVDAKGDLIAATANDTPARLAVGANGETLVADSSTPTGLKWAAPATGMTNPMTTTGDIIYSSSGSTPARRGIGTTGQILTVSGGVPVWATPAGGGKVLQVVAASSTTETSSTTTSFIDTTLTATITPTASTSKILVLVSHNGVWQISGTTGKYALFQLLRGASVITAIDNFAAYSSTTTSISIGSVSTQWLDSPATTSATTYKTQIKLNNSGTVVVQKDSSASTIVLMEIGA